MGKYFKTRVRPKGQVTLPGEIRELLDLNEGGATPIHRG